MDMRAARLSGNEAVHTARRMQRSPLHSLAAVPLAELIDANDAQNVARYRNTLTGNEFENGEWSSVEIHAATDKRAIGDAGVNQWRQAFGAQISG